IGGVDCGTKGRAQRRLLHVDVDRVCGLRAKTNPWPLPNDDGAVRVRTDVETDADYDANHLALARLLAAKQKSEVRGQKSEKFDLKAGRRESSTFRVIDRFMRRNF